MCKAPGCKARGAPEYCHNHSPQLARRKIRIQLLRQLRDINKLYKVWMANEARSLLACDLVAAQISDKVDTLWGILVYKERELADRFGPEYPGALGLQAEDKFVLYSATCARIDDDYWHWAHIAAYHHHYGNAWF